MKEVLVTQTMSNLHPKERSESEVASGGRGKRRTRKVFSYGRGGLSFPLPTTGKRNLDAGRFLDGGLQLRGGADWEEGGEEEEEEMTDHEGARKKARKIRGGGDCSRDPMPWLPRKRGRGGKGGGNASAFGFFSASRHSLPDCDWRPSWAFKGPHPTSKKRKEEEEGTVCHAR